MLLPTKHQSGVFKVIHSDHLLAKMQKSVLSGKPRKIVNEVNLKLQFYSEKKLSFPPLNLCWKPPILYKLQTENKELPPILQDNLVNSLMFVYQDITELSLYIKTTT